MFFLLGIERISIKTYDFSGKPHKKRGETRKGGEANPLDSE